MTDQNLVDENDTQKINDAVYEKGYVDREDLMHYLEIIKTSDSIAIIRLVKAWLQGLSENPKYSKVVFPRGDIDAVIGDLDSYGRVQSETIAQFKRESNKTLPIS